MNLSKYLSIHTLNWIYVVHAICNLSRSPTDYFWWQKRQSSTICWKTYTQCIYYFDFPYFSECPLAEFVTSPFDHEKIPFVFLPLASGQAVYPSARIKIGDGDIVESQSSSSSSSSSLFASDKTSTTSSGESKEDNQDNPEPICVVSSTDLMYKDGWHNLEKIYNGLHPSPLHASNNGATTQSSQNFYHHPLRLVQQPNAKTQLQVKLINWNIFLYIQI